MPSSNLTCQYSLLDSARHSDSSVDTFTRPQLQPSNILGPWQESNPSESFRIPDVFHSFTDLIGRIRSCGAYSVNEIRSTLGSSHFQGTLAFRGKGTTTPKPTHKIAAHDERFDLLRGKIWCCGILCAGLGVYLRRCNKKWTRVDRR